VRGAAVRVENVRLFVEREGDSEVLDGALVQLRPKVVDGHLFQRIDRRLDSRLGEEEHLLRVVRLPV